MKTVRNFFSPYNSTSLKTYLESHSLEVATCWKLTPRISLPALATIGATSFDTDLVLDGHPGVVFKATKSVLPTATDSESGLGSSGLEIDSIFDSTVLTEESIAAGDWNSAYFEIFIINYTALKMGEYVMFSGFIGDVKAIGNRFRAEGRPLTARSREQVGLLQAPKCDVRRLGDSRCKVNKVINAADGGAITVTGTVTTGGSNLQFTDSSKVQAAGYFRHGVVKFTSGVLNGREAEIKDFGSGVFTLHDSMPRIILAGVTYTAERGCDRLSSTCHNVYGNIINYRGFPKVPGLEKAFTVKPEIRQ